MSVVVAIPEGLYNILTSNTSVVRTDRVGTLRSISLTLGFVSIPPGVLIRIIPTPPRERPFIKMKIMSANQA